LLAADATALNPLAFENALRKAREFETSGPVYDHIHNRLWPLVDLVQQLVNQVQFGSQGPQVMIVQDSMNRFQNLESPTGLASLPLRVDGQFGSKTLSRVKEFQADNDLETDGVVGPLTRGAIQSLADSLSTV
jgi:peptidoglycan hydrolase-like protein with peptidoglycan-binding domain